MGDEGAVEASHSHPSEPPGMVTLLTETPRTVGSERANFITRGVRELGTQLFPLCQGWDSMNVRLGCDAFLVLATDCQEGFTDGEWFQAWASPRNADGQVQSASTTGEWAARRTGGTGNPPPRIVSMEMQ